MSEKYQSDEISPLEITLTQITQQAIQEQKHLSQVFENISLPFDVDLMGSLLFYHSFHRRWVSIVELVDKACFER